MTEIEFKKYWQNLPLRKQTALRKQSGYTPRKHAQIAKANGLRASVAEWRVIFALQNPGLQGGGFCNCETKDLRGQVKPADDYEPCSPCAAEYFPTQLIFTDEKRFQNRVNAFSEASAESVATHYNANKFDPIVVWRDPRTAKVFVISGHSRLEGMKRRKEHTIPVRFFIGTEAQAIQFAKVEANRSATLESFVEDMAAYRLMRDGDPKKGLTPVTKAELARVFKGRHTKLEKYAYLDPNGKFINALSQDDKSLYPYIETKAQWAGEIRKEYPHLTNIHERDIFNFIYSDKQNLRLNKDEFLQTIIARIKLGKDRLFPECSDDGCELIKDVSDLLKSKREKEIYGDIDKIFADIDRIRDRFTTSRTSERIYTDPEKDALRNIGIQLQDELQKLQRELGVAQKAKDTPAMFGLASVPVMYRTFFPYVDEYEDDLIEADIFKLALTEKQKGKIRETVINAMTAPMLKTPYYKQIERFSIQNRKGEVLQTFVIGELRPKPFRIFTAHIGNNEFILLHICRKKRDELQEKNFNIAKKRLKQWYYAQS